MKAGIKYYSFIIGLCLLFGLPSCSSFPQKHSRPCVDCSSICNINNNPDAYIGRVVRIVGVYKTDNMHFSYIQGLGSVAPRCKYFNLISIGSKNNMGNRSVAAFFNAGHAACEKKMATKYPMCIQAANIDVYAVVMRDEDGLSASIKKVVSYKFLKKYPK